MQREGDVACELHKVWPEALEVQRKGVGCCVDVQRLVSTLFPAALQLHWHATHILKLILELHLMPVLIRSKQHLS